METEIIAEIGVNWDGNFDYAEFLIRNCKEFGCSAVKFQAFNKDHWKNYPQFPNLKNTTITENNIQEIDWLCKANKIEWFCTPTYPEAVDWLDLYVYRYKIRYKDQDNEEWCGPILGTLPDEEFAILIVVCYRDKTFK